MLNDRVMYFGLIKNVADTKRLIDNLPFDFISRVNMLLASPTIVDKGNSVDIRPYERKDRLTHKDIKIPDGAKMLTKDSKGALVEFHYAEGDYRVLERNLLS